MMEKTVFTTAMIAAMTLTANFSFAQGTEEVVIAEMLSFTNELSAHSDNPDTKKVMNGVNSLYNATYDIKDAFTGKGSASALNQSALDLVNSIAAISNNTKLHKTVQNMNEFNAVYQNSKARFGSGLDATTSNTMDGIALTIQGATLLHGIFSKQEVELTKGQIATQKYMIYTNNLLQKIHKEYTTLPANDSNDLMALQRITAFENRLENYDKATSKQRLLVLKYLNVKGIPEFNTLQTWTKEIQNSYATNGLEYTKEEVQKLTIISTEDHLKNAVQGLQGAKAAALLFKLNYYYKNGNETEAAKISEQLASIATSETYNYTKNSINKAFGERNYQLAAQYYPLFFAQWYRNMNNFTYNKTGQMNEAKVSEEQLLNDMSVIGKGCVAFVKTEQYTNAANYLEQAKTVYDDYIQLQVLKKQQENAKKKSNNYVSIPQKGTEAAYFKHAEGEILQKNGKFAEALQKIDIAISSAPAYYSEEGGYVYLIKETKINLLIQLQQYDKALSECAVVESSFIGVNGNKDYNAANFKFLKALVFFNMQKFQPALGTLTALKAINPDIPKAYILEKEIYLAMGDKDSARKAEAALTSLYKK
jgi:hypothetical protein